MNRKATRVFELDPLMAESELSYELTWSTAHNLEGMQN